MTTNSETTTPAPAEAPALPAGPVLLYDGECGVCAASVQWVLKHERSDELRFAPLQSQQGNRLRQAAGVAADVDSLVWMDVDAGGRPRARFYSGAILAVLRYVGGPWLLAWAALWLVPTPLRNWGYRSFARIRKWVAPNQCLLPTPGQRARFLSSST